jgi:hypothetical protein
MYLLRLLTRLAVLATFSRKGRGFMNSSIEVRLPVVSHDA